MIVYLDGKYSDMKPCEVDLYAPGVLKAKGVFETLHVDGGRLLFWPAHYARLTRGIRYFRMNAGPDPRRIANIARKLARVNGLARARVRISVWRAGEKTVMMVIAQSMADSSGGGDIKGAKVCISDLAHPRKPYSHLKTLDYGVFREAYLDAQTAGYDEAVFLDARRNVVEGTRSNIFIVRDDVICTPPVSSGCLNGVTRGIILSLARLAGYQCAIRTVTKSDLERCDAAFLTNSIKGIVPVCLWGKGRRGHCKAEGIVEDLIRKYAGLIERYR